MYLSCIAALFIFLSTCRPEKEHLGYQKPAIVHDTTNIIVGAERTALYYSYLKDKKIACVVNQTSMVKNRHLIDTLLGLGIDVKVVFAPEHGFRGNADAGEIIDDSKDLKTGLPIISLYGKKKKPSAEDLKDIDIVVFDIQDVGVRFYTYISTLHYIMEACAENDLSLIVLDRPNPNAYFVDGPVLDPAFSSFVGMHPVPVVYGMTIGEYAQMINGQGWLKDKMVCQLTVIQNKNYKHNDFYELPIKPSPNLPDIRAVLLYPSICFFEGTTLSLGRGTNKPFQVIGHPALNSHFSFTPSPNEGAKDPPLNGKLCFGKDLSKVTTGSIIQSKKINLRYLLDFYNDMTLKHEKFFLDNLFFDKLAGNKILREQIIGGVDEAKIRESWRKDLDHFLKIRLKYLIYD